MAHDQTTCFDFATEKMKEMQSSCTKARLAKVVCKSHPADAPSKFIGREAHRRAPQMRLIALLADPSRRISHRILPEASCLWEWVDFASAPLWMRWLDWLGRVGVVERTERVRIVGAPNRLKSTMRFYNASRRGRG